MTDDLDEALRKVEQNANEEWKRLAKRAIRVCANTYEEFTSDEVWELLALFPDVTTHEPRAFGHIVRWAMQEKIIAVAVCAHCGGTPRRKSKRPEHHSHPLPVWRKGPNA